MDSLHPGTKTSIRPSLRRDWLLDPWEIRSRWVFLPLTQRSSYNGLLLLPCGTRPRSRGLSGFPSRTSPRWPTGSRTRRGRPHCSNSACRPHSMSPFLRSPVSPGLCSFSRPIPRQALLLMPRRLARPAEHWSPVVCKESLLSILIQPHLCFLTLIISGSRIPPCYPRKHITPRLPILPSPIRRLPILPSRIRPSPTQPLRTPLSPIRPSPINRLPTRPTR